MSNLKFENFVKTTIISRSSTLYNNLTIWLSDSEELVDPPAVRLITKIGLRLYFFKSMKSLMYTALASSSSPGRSINLRSKFSPLFEGTEIDIFSILLSLFSYLQASFMSLYFSNSLYSSPPLFGSFLWTRSLYILSWWKLTVHLAAVALVSFYTSKIFPIKLLRRVLFPALVTPSTT